MPFEVTILGTSSATPTLDRHPSAQVLNLGSCSFLIDCGEATQIQLLRYGIRSSRIDRIFISHLHPDHYLGLPGLLSTMSLQGRQEAISIYAPEGLQEILEVQFRHSHSHISFPIHFYALPLDGGMLIDEDKFSVSCFILMHRLPCWGFLFKEKKAARRIDKEKIEGTELPLEAFAVLKNGEDYTDDNGHTYRCEDYTQPSPRPDSYAYVTDTLFLPEVAESLRGVAMLYHEATFLHVLHDKAVNTFHSTARQAALFAKAAQAEKLLIGHFSSRYKDLDPLLKEAREIFPNTYLVTEGASFRL